jgi:hypothetical protein
MPQRQLSPHDSSPASRLGLISRWMQIGLVDLVLAWMALDSTALSAQFASEVAQEVDATRVRTLANHLPRWATSSNRAGLVPANQVLDQMTIVLARSPQQELAFEKLLADQQNPGSADYHR